MKFMTYNILKGGEGRFAALLEIIEGQAPDVLALQECNGFDGDGQARLTQLRRRLGMDATLATSDSGYHVALLARADRFEPLPPPAGLVRAAACAVVELGGLRLAVASLHLDPFDAGVRVRELQAIRAATGGAEHTLWMGDFNAISPRDVSAHRPETWQPRYRQRHAGVGVEIDSRALAETEAAGLVDLAAHLSATPAVTRPTRLYAHRDMPHQRLDYLFASAALGARVKHVEVVDDAMTQMASDHLPVVATFD